MMFGQVLKSDADMYITKPFHREILVIRVEAVMRRRMWDRETVLTEVRKAQDEAHMNSF